MFGDSGDYSKIFSFSRMRLVTRSSWGLNPRGGHFNRFFSSSSTKQVTVYFWAPNPGVGHASIQIGDEYFSLWPENFLSALGLGKLLPIKHSLVSSYKGDETNEQRSATYKVDITCTDSQFNKMLEKSRELKNELEQGKRPGFQLLRGFGLLNLTKVSLGSSAKMHLPALSDCPFSGIGILEARKRFQKIQNLKPGVHCTLAVAEILDAAGEILSPSMSEKTKVEFNPLKPYIVSPMELFGDLKKAPKTRVTENRKTMILEKETYEGMEEEYEQHATYGL